MEKRKFICTNHPEKEVRFYNFKINNFYKRLTKYAILMTNFYVIHANLNINLILKMCLNYLKMKLFKKLKILTQIF